MYNKYNTGIFLDNSNTFVLLLLPEMRTDVPRELRRRKQGCCAGVERRARKISFKPVLPSIIMGNLRSLVNKMDELTAVTRHQSESLSWF